MTARPGGSDQRRVFPKSWGAEFVRAGEVRFRVWAPGAERLSLRLDGSDSPMSISEEGWFELFATGVAPGSAYSFVLPDGLVVPDPASRAQARDVHGPSLVVDPTAYAWHDAGWSGRPWEEAVIQEIHIGTFTPEGTFRAAAEKLPHLKDVGITAVEIMPVAQFSGDRGWGYDGVLLYAPHRAYGAPDDMKAFVDKAHALGLMVLLDVVYNHFGPDGNYLHRLAPEFFDQKRSTPWGAAIAYQIEPVRQFFVENALYWLEEFHLDGLRFDAIDQIRDPGSKVELLEEIALRIRHEIPGRIHLTTEDNRNITRLHERDAEGRVRLFTGEWNDDFHNAAHVIATGETDGYYEDFAADPERHLARALAEGFAYQGEASQHMGGKPRGSPSAHLPPVAFVDFLQNHDQIGNRALGERLSTLAEEPLVRCLTAILLLSPHIPLLFMGDEWGEKRPFYFFTDFHGELAEKVREGRRSEFAKFSVFASEEQRSRIPDPNERTTFENCVLDWSGLQASEAREWVEFTRRLLQLRRQHVIPLLTGGRGHNGVAREAASDVVAVDWSLGGTTLMLRANLSRNERHIPEFEGDIIFAEPGQADARSTLPGPAVVIATRRR